MGAGNGTWSPGMDEEPQVRSRPQENAIREVKLRKRSGGVAKSNQADAAAEKTSARAIPEAVRAHFVQLGEKFYFSDGTLAFKDHEKKLTTRSENTQLIADLVAIAQARGWREIAVSGSERFRQESWKAAQRVGIEVRGYRPNAVERAQAQQQQKARAGAEPSQQERGEGADRGMRAAAKQASSVADPVRNNQKLSRTDAQSAARVVRPEAAERSHSGTLLSHGPAPYRHQPDAAMSYVVRLATRDGEREVWGVDLERALRESLSRPEIGDEVMLRAVGRERVKVKVAPRSGAEASVAPERETYRNRWQIETRAFLAERKDAAKVLRDPKIDAAQGARQHPQLLGAYLQLRAAELAAKRFRDPEDQRRFVEMVREAVANNVARGAALPVMPLRTKATSHEEGKAGDSVRAKGDDAQELVR